MLKIRALNNDGSSDEDVPGLRKEAQEEIALDIYNKALRLQCSDNSDEAKKLLYQLLQDNIPLLECQGGLPKTMSTIKYSCYINIGAIAMHQQEEQEALESFVAASEIDKTDVTLWYKIGKLALKLDKFRLSAHAFVQGLECSDSHWPSLDQLISVLFAIQDTIACLQYIGKALMLDPYYVKGIVLRKQIYHDYPGTDEYYKLFNPDSKYEPTVTYEPTEDEEKEFLTEVRNLCDRINAADKLLETKPLTTIPLPKGLKDFTWVDLGTTITELHQYLTDNDMTHLTKIDIKRCMSYDGSIVQPMEEEPPSIPEEQTDVIENNNDIVCNEKEVEMVDQQECEDLTPLSGERRPSQQSENDIETEETEQENEEQQDLDETSAQKQDGNRSLTKSSKRKRDLVSDLQIWGWHSKRKSAKRAKTDKDFRIEDALVRIIPSHLKPSRLFDDDTEGYFGDSSSPIDPSNELSSASNKQDTYFGSDNEIRDVKQFWSRNWKNCDAIDLIEAFVYAVANLWMKKWPIELVNIYVTAYNMLREHASHPPLFNDEIDFEILRRDVLATLLFGELTTHTNNKKYLEEELHCSSVNQLTIVSGFDNLWLGEYNDLAIRVHWLRAHLFKKRNENHLAIMALELIQDVFSLGNLDTDSFKLKLPNNEKHQLINYSIIKSMLSKLELIDSLSRIEELYEKQSYAEVAEILKLTFNSSNSKVTYGKYGRPAQLGILIHALWYINQGDCFVWTEECLYETLGHIIRPSTDRDKWELVLEKCLLIMCEIIKNETVCVIDILSEEKRCRFVDTLTTLCRRQINTDAFARNTMNNIIPYPWILMHYILLRDEHKQQAKKVANHISKEDRAFDLTHIDEEDDVSPSIAILFSAHEFLGPKALCLSKQGELLHFMLDTIINRLDTPLLEPHRDKIDIHLEQAFFCLYQHPCKKNKVSRHLADHNVNPLPLTWERAQQLYDYFCPEALPEFDSYKSISISSDLEQLLQRITAIIPKECDPQPMQSKVSDYIHGTVTTMSKPVEFPNRIKAIYYLLGDYYFKQSEVKRSYKYFLLDLCINPDRIDTWAGLALGIHSQLEYKLNHCERFKNEMEFLEKAKSAKICFKEALKLNNSHVTLWIEFGSFEYMVHAFCSRVLKYESETLSMEKFEALEAEKESYLESSCQSFQRALELYQVDQGDADERWLFHYMIAKIAEKKQQDPQFFMNNYMQAAALLHENKCQYPEKINYNNPQHLSLEALEVHYRTNASILKYLEAHDGKPISNTLGKLFKKCLDNSVIQKSKYETKNNNKTELAKLDNIGQEVRACMNDMLRKIEQTEKDAEKGSDSDDVIIIESPPKPDVIEVPRIKVRSIHEIMEEMMKEPGRKITASPNDNKVVEDVAISNDLPRKATDEKSDKSEKDARSEDEANIRKSATATEDSSTSSSSSSSSSSSESESDDSSSVTSSSDSSNENMSDTEIVHLVDRCIVGLEHCIRRLPQNYKALYRLAHVYYSYSKKKDLEKCKMLLLGEYKCKNSVLVSGLFSDRKNNNFFNGIWRIPSSEIDRPGSLSAHMSRCVTLLLQVLRDIQDHKLLLELCLQLRRIPDQDKVYIRHSEREQLSEDALTMCIQTLRTQLKDIETMSPLDAEKLIIDLYKVYQRSQKNLAHQEKVFAGMLVEAYKKITSEKSPETTSFLDLAIKFCQQTRVAEKLKRQQTPTVSPRPISTPPVSVPGVTITPPILPPPPSNLPIASAPSVKRPPFGRPRGRPPGPAKSSQNRSPRGRSPLTNPFPWQNPLYPQTGFDYFKHYQEELLRQYSHSQTMTQFAQSLFGTGSTLGLPSSTAAASSLLSSTSGASVTNPLLNPSLLQSMQQLSAPSPLSHSLTQLNPNLLKQTIDSLAMQSTSPLMTGLSTEKLLQFTALAQQAQQTKPVKAKTKSKQTTKTTASHMMPNLINPSFKYPASMEVKNKQIKPKPSTYMSSSEIPQAHSSSSTSVHSLTSSMDKQKTLMKDRPSISITPIHPPNPPKIPSISPGLSTSPGKTLQEKLADKQKQQKKAAKNLDFPPNINGSPRQTASNTPPIPYSMFPTAADLKNYQAVIPNYLLESGLSISQVQQKNTKPSPTQSTSKPKPSASSMPISMSVVKKPPEKKPKPSTEDDVIIIE